jgi:predicted MFS family arabinose efflux permease
MWLRIAVLALGTFAIGTDGFVVAGVLQEIAGELNVSITVAGQVVTVFAFVYALSSPLLASMTSQRPRRRLLLMAMTVFIAGNLLAALATSYSGLLAGRVIAAMAAAAYTPSASVAATIIAGEQFRGRALAMVLGGITVATIIGVPLGTWLSEFGGFRAAFWLVTGLGIVAFAGLALWLPDLPGSPAVSLRDRLDSLRLPGVPGALLVTMLATTAGFAVYTYIGPFLTATLNADVGTLGVLLMVFGVAGALGNGMGGWLVDHWGAHRTIILSLSVLSTILAVLPWFSATQAGAALGLFIWSMAGWLLSPAQQHRLLTLVPPYAGPLLISLNASALYLGIGSAGVLGGLIIQAWGAWALTFVAACIGCMTLGFYVYSTRVKEPRILEAECD